MFTHFQVSFFGTFFTEQPRTTEVTRKVSLMNEPFDDISWNKEQMPAIFTPVNTLETLADKRLLMIVWYADELTKEQVVVGYVNMLLNEFMGE